MNKFAKIADGISGWLTFEQRCGRSPLFCESYLAYPVGQLLQHRYPGRVLSEVEHPVLSEMKEGPGKKPRVDFAVTGADRKYDLVVEAKWVSRSSSLVRDIIRDVVRLDLVLPDFAREAILVLVGNVRDLRKLFQDPNLQPQAGRTGGKQPLSLSGDSRNAVYFFHSLSHLGRQFNLQVLRPFKDVKVSRVIQLERSGPYPRSTTTDQYEVYIWKVMPRGVRFKVDDYEVLSLSNIQARNGAA
jgi:hypothetical protein